MTNRYYGVTDNAITTLSALVTAGATSIGVISAAVFSAAELPFVITVADALADTNLEKMIVTAVNLGTNTLTVTRGFQSAAISHGNGSSVSLRVVAQHVLDIAATTVMQAQMNSYLEHTKNGTQQVTQTDVWEDSSKAVKLVKVNYTYADTVTKMPATAVRIIYKGDGATVRKTETCTFTYTNGEIANITRVIT